jgi:hypothetical protein
MSNWKQGGGRSRARHAARRLGARTGADVCTGEWTCRRRRSSRSPPRGPEEAKAVRAMLDRGLTEDGAARQPPGDQPAGERRPDRGRAAGGAPRAGREIFDSFVPFGAGIVPPWRCWRAAVRSRRPTPGRLRASACAPRRQRPALRTSSRAPRLRLTTHSLREPSRIDARRRRLALQLSRRNRRFCRDKRPASLSSRPLAMQKVEGSSPFSRFLERPGFPGLLCIPGAPHGG